MSTAALSVATRLADVLERMPTGRLVVLGEPGAGKTILMVRLVLDLLARRASDGPNLRPPACDLACIPGFRRPAGRLPHMRLERAHAPFRGRHD
jgi:hypothetical protein